MPSIPDEQSDSVSPDQICIDEDELLVVAQFDALRHQVPTLHMILLINITFLSFITSLGHINALTFLPSLLATLASSTRIMKWRREPFPGVDEARTMFRSTVRTSLIFGLILAGWSVHVLFTGSREVSAFVPFFAALSVISCAVCMVSLPYAAYAVIWSGAFPMVLAMLATRDMSLAAAAANLAIIAVLLIGWLRRQHQQFRGIVEAHALAIRNEREVTHMAFADQLTGLANRRALLTRLTERQRPEGQPLDTTVILLDLDGFKAVNDRLGHGVGDALLRAVADRLSQQVPPPALCARVGGDEFAILLPTGDREAVAAAAEHLSQLFATPVRIGADVIAIRGSIGISTGTHWPRDAVELMHRADLALYESKGLGLGHPFFFHPHLQQQRERRSIIETAHLDPAAVERLEVHFQPIVRTATDDIVGYEALARWQHPQIGVIPPDELFAVAEHARVAGRFTELILARAFAKASDWPSNLSLSVNVTAGEVGPGLCTMIRRMCERYAFSPKRLIVEITETALLRDPDAARSAIADLHAIGARVALDDFGSGFASIGYLRLIRFDLIKIDGGLVSSITTCALARQLLIGVVQLCRAIETPVVVEQVETEAQLDILRVLQVDKIQGYLLGRPAPELAPARAGRVNDVGHTPPLTLGPSADRNYG